MNSYISSSDSSLNIRNIEYSFDVSLLYLFGYRNTWYSKVISCLVKLKQNYNLMINSPLLQLLLNEYIHHQFHLQVMMHNFVRHHYYNYYSRFSMAKITYEEIEVFLQFFWDGGLFAETFTKNPGEICWAAVCIFLCCIFQYGRKTWSCEQTVLNCWHLKIQYFCL